MLSSFTTSFNLFKKSDALASGAIYLNQVGWNNNLLWGEEVKITLTDKLKSLSQKKKYKTMNSISANLNIMIKASEKASKVLIKDFGEIEKLQVSKKGPYDFVTKTDKNVEKIIIDA